MELGHPLDAAVRARLKAARPNQMDFARTIGRSAGWLNKYMHGAGNATLDDVIRMLALLIGVEAQPLSGIERRLLKAWRAIPVDRQEDAVAVLETVAKGYRRAQPQESNEPAVHTGTGKARRVHGKQKVAGG